MATFQNTVTIARPANEVFAFLADFGNIPAWNYGRLRIFHRCFPGGRPRTAPAAAAADVEP